MEYIILGKSTTRVKKIAEILLKRQTCSFWATLGTEREKEPAATGSVSMNAMRNSLRKVDSHRV